MEVLDLVLGMDTEFSFVSDLTLANFIEVLDFVNEVLEEVVAEEDGKETFCTGINFTEVLDLDNTLFEGFEILSSKVLINLFADGNSENRFCSELMVLFRSIFALHFDRVLLGLIRTDSLITG